MFHISLNDLGVYNTVNLKFWVPGHEGHEGNKRADFLAKKEPKNIQTIQFTTKFHSKLLKIRQQIIKIMPSSTDSNTAI